MTSLFELFKIGVGPSSSHTVGPMRAALSFIDGLQRARILHSVGRVRIDLYGSLALTGIGHGTDNAILFGLAGCAPDTITPDQQHRTLAAAADLTLHLAGSTAIHFDHAFDLILHRDRMYPGTESTHPNGMRFTAFDAVGNVLATEVYYSIGGGFIVTAEHFSPNENATPQTTRTVPYPFRSASQLLALAAEHNLTIADIVFANELSVRDDPKIPRPPLRQTAGTAEAEIRESILALAQVMLDCIDRGIATDGILPGGLNVRRRAARLSARLKEKGSSDPLAPLDWVTVFAMAVNEENAAGGRVVTAPTNGAAGVLPAIARYYLDFIQGADSEGLLRFFLTAAAIGILYKENASISGAEVGCQGEVGVACSMAAGGLVAALRGTNAQVEHAAEIAMEHNLGMTCDPIGGLVQIPCIERNAMGAVKAVNASRMAMNEPDDHKVSLDQVIRTMYLTGLDMQSRYKETSLAGLALNIIEC